MSGFTLVITPLISLMEDQLMYLNTTDVSAVMLNASSSRVRAGCSVSFSLWKKCIIKITICVLFQPIFWSHVVNTVTFRLQIFDNALLADCA